MSSVYMSLLRAVRTRLEGVEFCPIVRLRKRPVILPADTFPICLVCPGDGEDKELEAFTNIVCWRYPVIVGLVYEGNRALDLDESSQLMDVREAIRDELYQPTITVAQALDAAAFDIDMTTRLAFDFGGRPESNFEVSGFMVRYEIRHTRVA